MSGCYKKPRVDAATIHPSAARCAAHRFPSCSPAAPLCVSGERAAAFPFSSVSTKKPMQEEAKVGQQQQQPRCFHHSSSSCPNVLQSHVPPRGTSLTPSCCPATLGTEPWWHPSPSDRGWLPVHFVLFQKYLNTPGGYRVFLQSINTVHNSILPCHIKRGLC